jgi:hypothetical protein
MSTHTAEDDACERLEQREALVKPEYERLLFVYIRTMQRVECS